MVGNGISLPSVQNIQNDSNHSFKHMTHISVLITNEMKSQEIKLLLSLNGIWNLII